MIAVLDLKSGNIRSVLNALEKLQIKHTLTNNLADLQKAEKIIFPGQGRASTAMKFLKENNLIDFITNLKKPFLGICIGMQLLMDYSEEDKTNCLGIIPGKTKKFPKSSLKTPQIGWNTVKTTQNTKIFKDIPTNSHFYFVNSYFVDCQDQYCLAKTPYGQEFASVIRKENFYGTQFHPEKSAEIGLKLLNNFSNL